MQNIKKGTILIVSILVILVFSLSVSIGALAQVDDSVVTDKKAASVASYYVEMYSAEETSWQGATLSDSPVTYYSVDNQPVAYEFTVLNDKGLNNGFIIISATKDWMPVLERGLGKAPSLYIGEAYSVAMEKQLVNEGDFVKPIIYYFGAFSYYTQFGLKMIESKQMINLCMGDVIPVPEEQPILSFDKDQARAEWDRVEKAKLKTSSFIPSINMFSSHQTNTIVQITGVPSWWQSPNPNLFCDEGGGSNPYPGCSGPPDDPWANWDGCSPIAGAMVLGYWDSHGYPNFPANDDEYLIDDCHYYMFTGYSGDTPGQYIAFGIGYVSNKYSYHFTCTRDTSVTWSDITGEINAGRPFVLSASFTQGWGQHSVTVRAYDESPSPDQIGVHDTFDNQTHWVNCGDWTYVELAKVTPGY